MQRTITFLAGSILFMLIFPACKTSKLVKPMEKYDEVEATEVSILNIPVRISIAGLEKMINQQLNGVIYEDKDLNDGDKMMVRAEKKEDITLGVDSQLIKYRVPLDLWIRYDAGIAKVEAEGELALQFKTGFSIAPNWEMNTHTELESYEWIQTPKLKLGMVNLPIGFIADMVLKRSKDVLAGSIDRQIQENFHLEELIAEAWQQMHDPLLISEEYKSWLIMNPRSIGMTPLQVDEDTINSTIIVEALPEIRLGQKPEIRQGQLLPPFQNRTSTAETFAIHIRTEVPYEEAEKLTQDQVLGQTYDYGKRSFTIENVEMFGQGEFLIVNIGLSGSYTGNIYLQGRPSYNTKSNTIEIKDLKFTQETRNFLMKSAIWLLRSPIKKNMVETMNYYLDYNLEEIQTQLREQLANYELAKGVILRGDLKELNIQKAYLSPGGIKVDLALKGNVLVKIDGLTE